MKQRLLSFVVTIITIGAVATAYSFARHAAQTYAVTADVAQAPNLFAGGRVMVRGVEVGTISDVEPGPNGVRVTMDIDEAVSLPSDVQLSIVPITVIADRYVQLFPPYEVGPRLEDGGHIPVERTSIPAELDDVLAQLKGLLAALEPGAGQRRGPLARLIVSLDEAFAGRSESLAGTVEGSAAVLENLADSTSDITGLIRNLDGLFISLANRSSEIGLVNERFATVAESLAADQENLEGTIENIAFLSGEASRLVEESGDDLGASFGRLGRVLDAILLRQDALAAGMRWTNVIAQSLGEVDATGRGRFAYSGRQAAPGTAGATYNYRIDTRDIIGCERLGALVDSLTVINPNISVDELTNTALTFIPDVYDEDLRFLIEILLPPCADLPGEASLDAQARSVIETTARRVGEKRFTRMVARWYAAGVLEGADG